MTELKPVESDLYSTMNASKTDVGGKIAEHVKLLQDKRGAIYTPDGKTKIADDLVALYDLAAKLGWVRFEHLGGDDIARHINWGLVNDPQDLVKALPKH